MELKDMTLNDLEHEHETITWETEDDAETEIDFNVYEWNEILKKWAIAKVKELMKEWCNIIHDANEWPSKDSRKIIADWIMENFNLKEKDLK